MAKDPAFLFYTQDFLTGTMFMSNAQVGTYIRLLCAQHQHGGHIDQYYFNSQVAVDDNLIRNKFKQDDHGYYNERLLNEMAKRVHKSSSLSENAKKRWALPRNDAKPMHLHMQLHMPMHMPIENENINTTKTTDKKTINNKDKYIEFVYMYKKEYQTLCDQYTKQKADEYIERLNLYIGSKGVKYKSHYHTILTWMRKEGLLPNKEKSLPEPSKDCKVCFDPVAKKPSGWVYSREHGKNVPCKCRVG